MAYKLHKKLTAGKYQKKSTEIVSGCIKSTALLHLKQQ
jgi:hypothetical protein